MKPINTYIVLAYNTGNGGSRGTRTRLFQRCSNTATYRFNIAAKSPKEAEKLATNWLAERKLTARTRPPRTYFLDRSLSLKYKEIQVVYPKEC